MSAHPHSPIFGPAVGISAGIPDPSLFFKVAFHAPKATAGKVYYIYSSFIHIKNMFKNIVDIVYRIFENTIQL